MNLESNQQQKLLQKKARDFMEREIIPLADDYDRQYHPFPREVASQLIKKLKPLGYLGGLVPKHSGGDGLGYLSYAVITEELARAYASLAMMVLLGQGFAAWSLVKHGTEQQKARYLPALLSGDMVGCFGATEPNAGSDIRAIESTAIKEGNSYVLNGKKTWIVAGSIADLVTVVAYTDKGKGTDGLSWFIVDKEVSGFSTREIYKLGLRSCPMAEIAFRDCSIPQENLMVRQNEGYAAAMEDALYICPAIAAVAVGLAQAATNAAIQYAQQRKQFNRPIGNFQLIQEMIADMVIETQAARWLVYHACHLIDKGAECLKEISMAKAYATEAATRVTSRGIESHGAYGISEAYPVQRYLRDAHTLVAATATVQIHKLIVGRSALGITAFAPDLT